MASPGHLPAVWRGKVVLDGRRTLKRFFYPTAQKPVRMGIYGYSGNVTDEDLTPILQRTGEAVGNILYSHMSFVEVPGGTLRERIKNANTDIKTMTTEGWRDTSLMETLDAVILGSASMNDRGYIIETKVHTSDGKLVVSRINMARSEKDIKDVAKKVVRTIMEQYPFEGTLVSQKDENFQINLGKSDYLINRGMDFALMSPSMDRYGKVQGFRDIGTLRVRKTEKMSSWAEVVEIMDGETARIGYKAVRRVFTEETKRTAESSFVLLSKGGVAPDVEPLQAVNVYLDDKWVGTTDSKGKTTIPARIGRTYDLFLYRHGYQQFSGKVKPEREGEVKEFTLNINNSLLRVESQPSGARVYVDGTMVGRTPIRDGKQVEFGFHTLKLAAGEDYRDWEEVVEFDRRVIDLTGPAAIRFVKDYVALGKRAERIGDIDAAMNAYGSARPDHPDYSDARFRLAQLYMDEREDYTAAIREFENLLSLPENEQLIYKQYSVAYTNLGHAYYELGNGMIFDDREGAAQEFAKAVENLQRAKQYTRFFPTRHYDEALHDTYYYLALSYHKLYLITRKDTLLDRADFAWREYFDFFPKKLGEVKEFASMREAGEKYWAQVQDLM
jgi:tetratricopeptide (TPR) repeat protein